jgi:predicted porin
MKKTLVALAAVAATSAFAQVSLTGALGFDYARTAGTSGFENADAGSTNLAFTSVEDLGGGLKAKVYMQQRFNATNGANANSGIAGSALKDISGNAVAAIADPTPRALQNVYLNLSGGFGSISYGRILTGNLGAFNAFGEYGTNSQTFGDISETGNRHDNTILYTSPKFNGVTVDLATTVNPTGTEYKYARIMYSNGPLAVGYSQDEGKDNAAANGKNSAFGGSYDFKVAKVYVMRADNTGYVASALLDKSFYGGKNTAVGVTMPMGKATLKFSTTSGDAKRVTAVGVDCALSKTSGLFADTATESRAGDGSSYRVGFRTSF